MIKEIKYGGMSNVPGDYECADGELAVALNVVNENGELRPFVHPDPFMAITGTLMFVHKGSGYENFITLDGGSLYSQSRTSQRAVIAINVGNVNKIEALGNTLIVISDQPILYLLHKNAAYRILGNKPPELSISFGLQGEVDQMPFVNGLIGMSIYELHGLQDLKWSRKFEEFSGRDKVTATAAILGNVNRYIRERSAGKGRFMFPFLVRYAYRMYDGSWWMHSAPVLMIPYSGTAPTLSIWGITGQDTQDMLSYYMYAFQCELDYHATNIDKIRADIANWSDIITGVDIFVSAPLYTYDQNGEVSGLYDISTEQSFGIMNYSGRSESGKPVYEKIDLLNALGTHSPLLNPPNRAEAIRLPKKEIAEAINGGESLFYKIKSFYFDEIASKRTKITLADSVLTNLLFQERMSDDYNSHNTLTPTTSYVYNSRLNIADIKQKLFSGFNPDTLVPYINGDSGSALQIMEWYTYGCYTFIKQDDRDIVVFSLAEQRLYKPFGFYLFFPNARAYKMIVTRSVYANPEYVELHLTPHPSLNGAFYFGSFEDLAWKQGAPGGFSVSTDLIVHESNKLYNSEIANPFLFPPAGIVTVGSSVIKAITSTTKALSQGQFGQFPIYVFSSEGIWALELNEKGTFYSRQMVARDICNNPKSITQLDGAVAFTTDQGVMLIQGADVANISKALAGATFGVSKLRSFQQVVDAADISGLTDAIGAEVPLKEFLAECIISYDYPNSRLMVINPGKNYAYLYNLRNGLWSTVTSAFIHSTNNYPDSYLTDRSGRVSNLSAIISADDPRVVKGLIVSRPLKLDGADILKTVFSLIHKGQFEKSQVMQVLYASRDNITFQPIASSTDSFIRRLRGTPYKSFRVVIIPSFMKRNALLKTAIDLELKYTNKLR